MSATVSPRPSWMSLAPEVERVAAELEHPDLERHARPRGRLLEDHGQRLAAQGARVGARVGLDPAREVEDLLEVGSACSPAATPDASASWPGAGDDHRRVDGRCAMPSPVVLAAGRGARMGGPKALLTHRRRDLPGRAWRGCWRARAWTRDGRARPRGRSRARRSGAARRTSRVVVNARLRGGDVDVDPGRARRRGGGWRGRGAPPSGRPSAGRRRRPSTRGRRPRAGAPPSRVPSHGGRRGHPGGFARARLGGAARRATADEGRAAYWRATRNGSSTSRRARSACWGSTRRRTTNNSSNGNSIDAR